MYVVKYENRTIACYSTLQNAINYVENIGGFGNNRIAIVKEPPLVVD